jgi:hypothetical protein
MYFQHLHVEHKYFECEICNKVAKSGHAHRQHKKMHTQLELENVKCKFKWEQKMEYNKNRAFWFKGLVNESKGVLFKILNDFKEIINDNDELSMGKLKNLIKRLEYEYAFLHYYINIDGFSNNKQVYFPTKFPTRPSIFN